MSFRGAKDISDFTFYLIQGQPGVQGPPEAFSEAPVDAVSLGFEALVGLEDIQGQDDAGQAAVEFAVQVLADHLKFQNAGVEFQGGMGLSLEYIGEKVGIISLHHLFSPRRP
jgi:hypothetical protein